MNAKESATTFEQFKTICKLAEEITGINFCWSDKKVCMTRQDMLDSCDCFFSGCDSEDDHFYAILSDGRLADKEYETCHKTDLRNAYSVIQSDGNGTWFFFSAVAKKDSALLDDYIESEIRHYLWDYIDEDLELTSQELIVILKALIVETEIAA